MTDNLPVGNVRSYLEAATESRFKLEIQRDSNLDSQLNLYVGIVTALLGAWLFFMRHLLSLWDAFWSCQSGCILLGIYSLLLCLSACFGLFPSIRHLWHTIEARNYKLPMELRTLHKYADTLLDYYSKTNTPDSETVTAAEIRETYVGQIAEAADTMMETTNIRLRALTDAKGGMARTMIFLVATLFCFFVVQVRFRAYSDGRVNNLNAMLFQKEVINDARSGNAVGGKPKSVPLAGTTSKSAHTTEPRESAANAAKSGASQAAGSTDGRIH